MHTLTDLIFMDIRLSGMGGPGATRQLKERIRAADCDGCRFILEKAVTSVAGANLFARIADLHANKFAPVKAT